MQQEQNKKNTEKSTKQQRNEWKILVGKSEGESTLGRPRRRWEDIRMNLREIGWEIVDWAHLN